MLYIEELKGKSIRNLKNFSIKTNPSLNFFYGANASGKTSVLESIYLLSRLKSFRTKRISDVISRGDDKLQIFAAGRLKNQTFSVGIEKGRGLTRIKFNTKPVKTASEQVKKLPIYTLTPEHYILFVGSPKERRHWLDWSLFHVEQNYLDVWKNYHRALRHRNTLLKEARLINSSEIEGWEKQIAEEGGKIDDMREKYLFSLCSALNEKHLPFVLPGKANINYLNKDYAKNGLRKTLETNRNKEASKGYTFFGPHRTDILFDYQGTRVEKHLSRGQTKLFAASLISAQLAKLKEKGGCPIMLVDDLSAELDDKSSAKMLKLLLDNNTQTFVTSITLPEKIKKETNKAAVFHVEHGNIQKVVK